MVQNYKLLKSEFDPAPLWKRLLLWWCPMFYYNTLTIDGIWCMSFVHFFGRVIPMHSWTISIDRNSPDYKEFKKQTDEALNDAMMEMRPAGEA